jgi:hypothetical protein
MKRFRIPPKFASRLEKSLPLATLDAANRAASRLMAENMAHPIVEPLAYRLKLQWSHPGRSGQS